MAGRFPQHLLVAAAAAGTTSLNKLALMVAPAVAALEEVDHFPEELELLGKAAMADKVFKKVPVGVVARVRQAEMETQEAEGLAATVVRVPHGATGQPMRGEAVVLEARRQELAAPVAAGLGPLTTMFRGTNPATAPRILAAAVVATEVTTPHPLVGLVVLAS